MDVRHLSAALDLLEMELEPLLPRQLPLRSLVFFDALPQ